MVNMTEELILANGYNKYEPSKLDSKSVDACYQKCIKDVYGKRYYIDIKHYNLIHPHTGDDLSGYEISTQVYLYNSERSKPAVNITFLDSDLYEAEDFLEKLFKEDTLEYYEEFK